MSPEASYQIYFFENERWGADAFLTNFNFFKVLQKKGKRNISLVCLILFFKVREVDVVRVPHFLAENRLADRHFNYAMTADLVRLG